MTASMKKEILPATSQPAAHSLSVSTRPDSTGELVNDFSITVATVNGSGSQTSNSTLVRALFKMGIPVSGKNLFPSNIQGQPTWYTIRVNKDGFLARKEAQEIMVAMNPATFAQDLADVAPGGVFFYDDSIRTPINRQDIVAYPMPVKKISRDPSIPTNLRDYVANMVYVGVVACILGIDLKMILQALTFHFRGKQKAIDLNYGLVVTAFDWAKANLHPQDRFRVEPMKKTKGYIMADGNTAAALGSLYGGMQFCAWYPITPATTLAEAFNEYVPILRKDPETGKFTCAVVQAEDELAAIGMVIGAGWAGLRSMTSTSGPGISLMTEYIGLAYFAEVPVVVWDVQRVGPATGLPTRTAQGDITQIYFASHGDTQMVMLFPGSVNECFEFGWKAFDLAERLQTPVFALSDLDFGMNQWMTRPFEYPAAPMDRGKVLWEEDIQRILDQNGTDKVFNGQWGRYLDVDGDGIPYRTVPGNRHPKSAYFTRGTGHNEFAVYSENPEVWERVLDRIKKKFETARTLVPKPVIETAKGAKIGLIFYGSTEPAVSEARHILAQQGIATDSMRIRAVPFTPEVVEFIGRHKRNYVIELNRDGQMHQLLSLETPQNAANLISLSHIDGLPLTADWVVKALTVKNTVTVKNTLTVKDTVTVKNTVLSKEAK
jgi:2-oxoglutarate ferredoxin oxidoreductase subunit alpha